MRLRGLSHGQSFMFVAPPEVHLDIKKSLPNDVEITGWHVVSWCLEQSCLQIEQAQPMRILQGLNFARQQILNRRFRDKNADANGKIEDSESLGEDAQEFVEQECKTLADLYAPAAMKDHHDADIVSWARTSNEPWVRDLLRLWDNLPDHLHVSAGQSEEHEREISHEIERETQIQRPPHVEPLEPHVDPTLHDFIEKGSLEVFTKFSPVYDVMVKKTSLKPLLMVNQPWYRLRTTTDFARTVDIPENQMLDNFLRPVNFILTSVEEGEAGTALLISPFEANALIHKIRDPDSRVNLYMYEPRVAKNMQSVDAPSDGVVTRSTEDWVDGTLSRLRRELHMFAGQLYFNTFEDYVKARDKDLGPRLNKNINQTLSFYHQWLAIRCMGRDFSRTHAGYLASGRPLTREAFERG